MNFTDLSNNAHDDEKDERQDSNKEIIPIISEPTETDMHLMTQYLSQIQEKQKRVEELLSLHVQQTSASINLALKIVDQQQQQQGKQEQKQKQTSSIVTRGIIGGSIGWGLWFTGLVAAPALPIIGVATVASAIASWF